MPKCGNRNLKFRMWHRGHSCMDFFEHEDKGLPIMQFTGLLDKNGKEIYEGDIVKHTCDGIEEYDIDFIKPITWENCSFFHGEMILAEILDDPLEIIGNIYENPEMELGRIPRG